MSAGSTMGAGTDPARFPPALVWPLVGLSFVPLLLGLAGVDLGVTDSIDDTTARFRVDRAVTIHVLLEWTGFCIAAFTVVFAVSHYAIRRDVTTPIIGAALCVAGFVDAFRALALLGVTGRILDPPAFIPFTWALSRAYHASILVLGALPFVWNRRAAERRLEQVDLRYLAFAIVAFLVVAFTLVDVCASRWLPRSLHPDWPISRPWDVPALLVYMLAIGFVFPRYERLYPSLFAHGLLIAMVPNILAQCHAAFGSRARFDHDSISAQLLKILAYLVPLCGLILDYVRAHASDVEFRTTREKLRLARDVQQGLLPQRPPDVAGLDVAGRSRPIEAVGGDYFDYLLDDEGRVGIVVGDVSGHELAAAIVLAQTRAYLRALATAHTELGPMLTELNDFLCADLRDRWFVTMFFARLDPRTRCCEYAAAGHEACIVRVDGTILPLPANGPPLGMMDAEVRAAGEAFPLEPGDVLLVTSDGVHEAVSPTGEPFGVERASQLVAGLRERPAGEIVAALFAAVEEFRGGGPATDDVTVVAAKWEPRAETR